MYNIEPVFIIFPFIVGLLAKFGRHPAFNAIIYLIFLFLFILSENGPDYYNYQEIFNLVAEGKPFSQIHGEYLFLLTMKGAYLAGLGYKAFRVLFLGAALLIFCFYLNKFTDNFALSFLMLYLGFIAYTISAYRQFMTMAFILASLYYLLVKDKKLASIIAAVIATLWHISGVVMIAFTLFYTVAAALKDQNRSLLKEIYHLIRKNILLLVFLAFMIRLFMYELIDFFELNLIGGLSYKSISRVSFGLFSRTAMLILIADALGKVKYSRKTAGLFVFYSVSLLLYLIFPYEFLMGRLTNNARFLDIILVPQIYYAIKEKQNAFGSVSSVLRNNYANNFLALAIITYSAMFIYQLLFQVGYSPYIPFWRTVL